MNTHVCISGMVLSLLQFEHLNRYNQGDLEGLLFGKVVQKSETFISDGNDKIVSTTTIYITSFEIIENRFYGINGTMKSLPSLRPDLVGLFKCRKDSILHPTLRDVAIFESLLSYSPHMIFGLLTAGYPNGSHLHIQETVFYQKKMERIKFKITNIGPLIPSSENKVLYPQNSNLSKNYLECCKKIFIESKSKLNDLTKKVAESDNEKNSKNLLNMTSKDSGSIATMTI